jgi:hypothetical protein
MRDIRLIVQPIVQCSIVQVQIAVNDTNLAYVTLKPPGLTARYGRIVAAGLAFGASAGSIAATKERSDNRQIRALMLRNDPVVRVEGHDRRLAKRPFGRGAMRRLGVRVRLGLQGHRDPLPRPARAA